MQRGAGVSLVGALVLIFAGVAPARAAVTVGQLAFEDNPHNCPPTRALVTIEVAALAPFDAPFDGVITSWQTKAGEDSGGTDAKLKVFRETDLHNTFLVVGQSAFQPISASSINGPFPVRIPVEAGDYVSIRTGDSGGPCWSETAVEADRSLLTQGEPDAPDGALTFFGGNLTQLRANVAAVLEADGDRDSFGDDTQDRCLGLAGPVQGCPDNNFLIGGIVSRKKGVVRITVYTPGPGFVAAEQAASRASASKKRRKQRRSLIRPSAVPAARGPVSLRLEPTRAGRKRLAQKMRIRVPVRITFTPTSYLANSAVIKVTMKRKGPATTVTPQASRRVPRRGTATGQLASPG
jgi:hypothetical protein